MSVSGIGLHYGGIAAGALLGIGAGAFAMSKLGHTQEKVDARSELHAHADGIRRELDATREELRKGELDGSITLREQQQMRDRIELLEGRLDAAGGFGGLIADNWLLPIGGATTAGGVRTATGLDRSNWTWQKVQTRPGSELVFFGDARSTVGEKWEMVKVARTRWSFTPGFVGGIAGGVLAGMVGMRIAQQFANRPSQG